MTDTDCQHPQEIPVAPLSIEPMRRLLDCEAGAQLDRDIQRAHQLLTACVVWNINSTAVGGGVAEMLQSLLAYTRGAGIDARWLVIRGDQTFFRVTKRLHNFLHGDPGDGGALGAAEQQAYLATTARNAAELAHRIRPQDIAILHDPQTAGLIPPLKAQGAIVVWRSHVESAAIPARPRPSG
jgi:trehalose synthase